MNLREYVQQKGQTGIAELLGVSQGLVSQWLSGKTKITAERAVQIEEATGREVTRQDLRPDLFGPPPAPPAPRALDPTAEDGIEIRPPEGAAIARIRGEKVQ